MKSKSLVRLNVTSDNIAGVHLPMFTLKGDTDEVGDDRSMLGLTGGGQAIQKCKDRFSKFLRTLVDIASLQTQFITLDEVIKVTNRRVNALEFVVLPRILFTISYIEQELDEESREDFTRLKKVTDNKKNKKISDAKERAEHGKEQESTAADTIFGDDDDDVVF